MKKTLLALAFLLALPAFGQATITNDYSAGQVARITRAMNRENAKTCAYFGLAANCTTPKMREQFCKRAGFGGVTTCDNTKTPPVCVTTPLVSDCPGATQFIVYPNITAFDKRTLLLKIDEWAKEDDAADRAAAKAAWDAKTQAQKDALCPSFGLTAPCTPF